MASIFIMAIYVERRSQDQRKLLILSNVLNPNPELGYVDPDRKIVPDSEWIFAYFLENEGKVCQTNRLSYKFARP